MEPSEPVARVTSMHADLSAVSLLYARTWAPLVGLLISMGGSRSDAEEIAQEAFEKLVRSWEKVRGYDDPAAWLRMIAVRLLISRDRRSKVAQRHQSSLANLERMPSHADAAVDRVDVATAMAQLSMEHRTVLLLHYVCDLSVEGIGTELKIPTGTVKSRLARAREALGRTLEPLQER